ncbi:CapA family protein [Beggiatoa leptomitoformis]|uniref:CapA family protein n=1 Tax=Beggiatoa leptomitoformis TaxID=288004 RepID=A0A2N9YGL5_9GAMM|nr:CapA family protein [Beggiatoa leptomitoformis]ALG68004.1 CapA family protein [Beggiatoa leptomitoformis]AUI69711.1 CapA family protein [Beggiatoa leptomitoformis]
MFQKPLQTLILCLSICISPQSNAQDTVSIIGVGDMMLGTNYPQDDLPPNNGKELLANVQTLLSNADVTFGNLEGVVLNEGGATGKVSCNNCFSFRMPEYLIDNLVTAGFDVVSIANNHVGDFGTLGMQNTLKVLKQKGINAAGFESVPSTSFTRNGVRYGFAAFAPNNNVMDLRDIPAAKRLVAQLAQDNDIVIISFHGGAEGSAHQHVTRQSETFYSENRGNVYAFAHAVVDAGADVVFGQGPHVTRAVEVYKNRFIAYSLGNFCTYGPFNVKGVNGVSPLIKVDVDKNGQFIQAKVVSTQQTKRSPVTLDSEQTAYKLIQSLTKTDFPESRLNFSSTGIITQP